MMAIYGITSGSSTIVNPIKRFCRARMEWCYAATETGTCSLTACMYPDIQYSNKSNCNEGDKE